MDHHRQSRERPPQCRPRPDAGAVRRFADEVVQAFPSSHPAWDVASTLLFFAAEPTDHDFGDSIWSAVTEAVGRVLTLTNAERTRVTWVTPQMCEEWGVESIGHDPVQP